MFDLTLDHVVIAVSDLDAATHDYTVLLGRSPSWRGAHPKYGTRNTLFRLDNTYVELLGVSGRRGKGNWRGDLEASLERRGEGLFALALGTPDIDATAQEVRRRGLDIEKPADGHGIDSSTGARRDWRNARVPVAGSRGVRIFFIEHKSPPDALPPAELAATDGTSAKRVDHLVVLSADMQAAQDFWSDSIGARLALDRTFPDRDMRIFFYRLGDITIEISGGARQTREGLGKPDRLWGISWHVDDIAATCERLRAAGIDVSDPRRGIKPGTLVATVRDGHTHGVATLLIEHTPQSFGPQSRVPRGEAFDRGGERRAFTLQALDHVILSTTDLDATAAKWERTLGLRVDQTMTEPVHGHMRLARLPAGNAFIELAQPLTDDHRIARAIAAHGAGMFSISVRVDDLDAAVRDLRAKGVPVSDPEDGVWPDTRLARINKSVTNGVSIQLLERR